MGLFRGLKGWRRKEALRQHTLTEFEKTMDGFIQGRVSRERLLERARKLKERGGLKRK
jgi:hypothetical protein